MVNSLGELKPLLTALVLPPSSPLLLVGVGVWLALRKSARLGAGLAAFSAGLLWLLSCNAVAVWLGAHALAQVQQGRFLGLLHLPGMQRNPPGIKNRTLLTQLTNGHLGHLGQ